MRMTCLGVNNQEVQVYDLPIKLMGLTWALLAPDSSYLSTMGTTTDKMAQCLLR